MSKVLHADFATDKSLAARVGPAFSIVRTTDASYFDSVGVMQTASAGEARFDHNPSTLKSLGLLREGARTNICLQSEDITNGSWTANGVITATANQGVAPDGSTTADDFIAVSDSDLTQVITVSANTDYAYAIFIKPGSTGGSANWVRVQYKDNLSGNGMWGWFSMSSGVTGTNSTYGTGTTLNSISIKPYASGWYRIHLNGRLAAGITTGKIALSAVTADGGHTSDTTNSVLVWGSQLEAGLFPTAYIPTTTVAVARNADIISLSDVSWFNAAASTLYTDATPLGEPSAAQVLVDISDNSASDRYVHYLSSQDSAFLSASTTGNAGAIISADGVGTAGSRVRMASAFAVNDVEMYSQGDRLLTGDQLVDVIVGASKMTLGAAYDGSDDFNGHIAEIRYDDERRANGTLAAFSTGAFDGEWHNSRFNLHNNLRPFN